MPTDLLTPILEGGLHTVNFFNGRVLTAEDLRQEQDANRRRHEQLGQACGEGVAEGLGVRLPAAEAPATVVVSPGLAFNRKGQALALSQEVTVAVVPEALPVPTGDGLFAACGPATAVPTGIGAYVLAVTPTSGTKGRAPKVGLSDKGVATTCDGRYVVEGVQFKLIPLDLASDLLVPEALRQPIRDLLVENLDGAGRSRLRNLLAHLCLGTVEKARFSAGLLDRLGQDPAALTYGPLDRLRPTAGTPATAVRLTDCDVPLALLFWTTDRIDFLDTWAVRRRLHRRPASFAPPFPALDRQQAEAEAAFLQFQAHVAEITRPGTSQALLAQVRAVNYFRFVPSAGVLPERVGTAAGFTHLAFFEGLTFRDPVFVEGAKLRQLFHLALVHAPFDLEERALIWLYRVRQNRQGAGQGAYLLFTSGHVPYQGDAQYDLARWNFSNYGLGVAESIILGG